MIGIGISGLGRIGRLALRRVVDGLLLETDGHYVRIVAWYDNEWAYSARLVDLAIYMGGKL